MTRRTAAFRASSKCPKEEPFDFAKKVAETYEMFPHIMANVIFIDVNAGKIVHSNPAIRAELVATINGATKLRGLLNMEMYKRKLEKTSAVMPVGEGKNSAYFVFLYLEKDLQTTLGRKHSHPQNCHLIFDHEFAHVMLKQAHGVAVLPETTADVYAAIRHFQRYGTETGTIEKLVGRRAVHAFFNQDGIHFTSPGLEKLIEVKDKIDFAALSPEETAALASRIARKGAIKPAPLKCLSRQFSKFKGALDTVTDDRALRKLAHLAQTSRSPDARKWSRVAVQAFLKKDIILTTDDSDVKLTGPYWRNIRKQISQHA